MRSQQTALQAYARFRPYTDLEQVQLGRPGALTPAVSSLVKTP